MTGHGIAVDTSGNAYVDGRHRQHGLPRHQRLDALRRSAPRCLRHQARRNRAHASTAPTSAAAATTGRGIAVDTSGNAYVTGETSSTNFPVTNGSIFGGGAYDAFVTKIAVTSSPPPPVPNPLPPPQPHPAPVGQPAPCRRRARPCRSSAHRTRSRRGDRSAAIHDARRHLDGNTAGMTENKGPTMRIFYPRGICLFAISVLTLAINLNDPHLFAAPRTCPRDPSASG